MKKNMFVTRIILKIRGILRWWWKYLWVKSRFQMNEILVWTYIQLFVSRENWPDSTKLREDHRKSTVLPGEFLAGSGGTGASGMSPHHTLWIASLIIISKEASSWWTNPWCTHTRRAATNGDHCLRTLLRLQGSPCCSLFRAHWMSEQMRIFLQIMHSIIFIYKIKI